MALAPQHRRGRPPGRLVDPTPVDALAFNSDVRIGWLLRSWRLHSRPDTNARSFATLLNEHGHSADASRVSRWETGQVVVPLDVIAAYEHVLGLARGSIVAVAIGNRKLSAPTDELAAALATHKLTSERFERVLDVVSDGQPLGAHWLEFAIYAVNRRDELILPMSLWRRLTGTLVRQIGLSVGVAYTTRFEAAILLTRHRRAKQALVTSLGEYVTDPESMLVADQISLLQEMTDHQASELVLRMLEQPRGPTRNGAAWVAAAKLLRGHFDREQLARLERIVVRLVQRDGLDDGGLFNRLADLVAALPADSRDRVLGAARFHPDLSPGREPLGRVWSRATVARVSEAASRQVDEPEDPMLERLVAEALFHANAERRFEAALTIAFSPHRDRVARGCAALVDRALVDGSFLEQAIVERLMVILTFVASPEETDLLDRVIECSATTMLRATALTARAHLRSQASVSRLDLWSVVSAEEMDETLVRAALYCAGMTGHPCLTRIVNDDALPEWRRQAARWWIRNGPAIHESAGSSS